MNFFLSGADKRAAAANDPVAYYELPNMSDVHVTSMTYKDGLAVDLYYPPDVDLAKPSPAVVFVHGVDTPELSRTFKDTGASVSWSLLAAADGMVGVTYDATKPGEDTVDLLNYLHTNANVLGIDPQRICLWAADGNATAALAALTKKDQAYIPGIRCAAILYGDAQTIEGEFPTDFALMAVRAGKDPGSLDAMTSLVDQAQAKNVDVTAIDYEDGEKGFDVSMDTPRTQEIIGQVLAFLQEQLQAKQQ